VTGHDASMLTYLLYIQAYSSPPLLLR